VYYKVAQPLTSNQLILFTFNVIMMKSFIFIIALLTLACSYSMTTYHYADGSGNRYTITSTQLSYDPVKPEESSSGVYSGGEPKTVSLTRDRYADIRTALEKAISNKAIHIPDRIKMSGLIIDSDGKKYLLAPGSAEVKELESLLRVSLQ
jgi:hypothetical protein